MDQISVTHDEGLLQKCTTKELERLSITELKTLYEDIGEAAGSKKRDDLFISLSKKLPSVILQFFKTTAAGDLTKTPKHILKAVKSNPTIKKIIDSYNHYFKTNQLVKKSVNAINSRITSNQTSKMPTDSTSRCICGLSVKGFNTDSLVKCMNSRCDKRIHRFCLKLAPSEEYPLFECPICVLSKCDPLHEVLETLIPPFIVDNKQQTFSINKNLFNELQWSSSAIEVRAIKLEDKSHEQCWPNTGELAINGKKVMEFRPLQQNSSLKKRKDEKYTTNLDIRQGNNTMDLHYKKETFSKKQEETFVCGVYFVKILSAEELVQKIRQEKRRVIEECKKMIVADFESSPLDIDMVSYPLTCVFDMQLLKTPAKGVHCKHINCFSLENFISVWQKNGQRKWTCPICKLKSYDIIVDSFFEKIMKELKEGNFKSPTDVNVEIRRDTSYKFVADDNDSDFSDNEIKPVVKQNSKAPEKPTNFVVLDESDEEGNQASPPQNLASLLQEAPKQQVQIDKSSMMQIEKEAAFVDQLSAIQEKSTTVKSTETPSQIQSPTLQTVTNKPQAIEIEDSVETTVHIQSQDVQIPSLRVEPRSQQILPTPGLHIPQLIPFSQPVIQAQPFIPAFPILTQVPIRQGQPFIQTLPNGFGVPEMLPRPINANMNPNPIMANPFQNQNIRPVNTPQSLTNNQNINYNISPQINANINSNPIMTNSNSLQNQNIRPVNTTQSPVKNQNSNPNIPHTSQIFKPLLNPKAVEIYSPTEPFSLSHKQSLSQNVANQSNFFPFGLVDVSQINAALSNKENLTPKLPHSQNPKKAGHKSEIEKKEFERVLPTFREKAKKQLEELIDLTDKRLELPTFQNFKTEKFADEGVNKETSLTMNRKLLTTLAKETNFQSSELLRHIQHIQQPKESGSAMQIENPTQSNELGAPTNGRPLFEKMTVFPKGLGREVDPICLD